MAQTPFTHRRSPRLAATTAAGQHTTSGVGTVSETEHSSWPSSWNQTGNKPSATQTPREVIASRGHRQALSASVLSTRNQGLSEDAAGTGTNDRDFVTVSSSGSTMFSCSSSSSDAVSHKPCLDDTRATGKRKELSVATSLVTPHCSSTSDYVPSLSNVAHKPTSSTQQARQDKLSTITPQEHEASLAVAALDNTTPKNTATASFAGNDEIETKAPQQQPPVRSDTSALGISPTSTFPEKLHGFLTELSRVEPREVTWVNGGRAFLLLDTKSDVLAKCLFKFFNHRKFSSLQRQLNMYVFKRSTSNRDRGAFHNDHFHRDPNKSDFGSIRRRGTARRPASRTANRKGASAGTLTSGPLPRLESGMMPRKGPAVGTNSLGPEEETMKRPPADGIDNVGPENKQPERSESLDGDRKGKKRPLPLGEGEKKNVAALQTKPRVLLAEVKQHRGRRSQPLVGEQQDAKDFTIKLVSVSVVMHDGDFSTQSLVERKQEDPAAERVATNCPLESPSKRKKPCNSGQAICFTAAVPKSPIVFENMPHSSMDPCSPPTVLPSLVDESIQVSGKTQLEENCDVTSTAFLRMTVADGQRISTSPLEAPAHSSTPLGSDVVLHKLVPSPVYSATASAELRVPPFAFEEEGSTPLPLSESSHSSLLAGFAGNLCCLFDDCDDRGE